MTRRTHRTHARAAVAAASTAGLIMLLMASPAAQAAAGRSGVVYSTGSFVPTDTTLAPNTGYGTITGLPDGSVISHMGCIASTPGGIGCSTNGLPIPIDTWYKRAVPTTAAAQAFADYGVLKGRTWRTEGAYGDSVPGDPLGTRYFYAEALSEWSDVFTYNGPPTLVTL